jgi:hypothetical protein
VILRGAEVQGRLRGMLMSLLNLWSFLKERWLWRDGLWSLRLFFCARRSRGMGFEGLGLVRKKEREGQSDLRRGLVNICRILNKEEEQSEGRKEP